MGSELGILHVDMDAFFASVEQRDNPALQGKPVIVGGPSKRGVVCAASYEARPFGVRSAMPMVDALRRCPQAEVVPPRHTHYGDVSRKVFEIFGRYTPLVEGLSFDEAFLDIRGSENLFGDGVEIATRIREDIDIELDLTASAGVASSKFVAKIASDLDKPNGLTVVSGDAAAFLAPLPIERMWGIGKKTAPALRKAGFTHIGALASADPRRLEELLGSWGLHVHSLARGIDGRGVQPTRKAKSIGAESTFEKNFTTKKALEPSLLSHSERVAARLYKQGLYAQCVQLKVKFANFRSITRRKTLPVPVNDATSIYGAALQLLERVEGVGQGVRLTGVSAAEVCSQVLQRDLFLEEDLQKRSKLQGLMAEVGARFGKGGLTRARLLEGAARPSPASQKSAAKAHAKQGPGKRR